VTLAKLPGDLKPLEGESGVSSFSGPICDLILAVFELDKKNNWLRRQAIVIILQQVLGGTIERRVLIPIPCRQHIDLESGKCGSLSKETPTKLI
jgi:hypothetical protein